jgi:NAD(P)-dependent dehydrogenase (short-subunit alcohol dehydrogenase family)
MEQQLASRAELAGKTVEEITRETLATQGLHRFAEPVDIANMVVFLCSPRARHVHGAGIAVDGGATKGVF